MEKILIIDDEPPVRKMLLKLLKRNDYEVLEASMPWKKTEVFLTSARMI